MAALPVDRLPSRAQAIGICWGFTASLLLCPHPFFVSSTCPTHALLSNVLSLFLRRSSLILCL